MRRNTMQNLKKLRIEKKISQQALADKLNTSQQSIYKYENQLTEPNLDMLEHMADFFDVSVDYLIGYSSCPHKIEEVTETALNTDELALLRAYRALPRSSRSVLKNLVEEFSQNHVQD